MLGEFVFSGLYFWPRNEIMFGDGSAGRSVEELQRTAAEFQAGHWARPAICAVTATLALIVLLRTRQSAPRETTVTA